MRRTIVIATAFRSARAMPVATKVSNATPVTKVTNCQTTCYNAGTQRICNTHCF